MKETGWRSRYSRISVFLKFSIHALLELRREVATNLDGRQAIVCSETFFAGSRGRKSTCIRMFPWIVSGSLSRASNALKADFSSFIVFSIQINICLCKASVEISLTMATPELAVHASQPADTAILSGDDSSSSPEVLQICISPPVPGDISIPDDALTSSVHVSATPMAGLLMRTAWAVGSTLTISFLGGSRIVQQRVRQYASQWEAHANIRFLYVQPGQPATIRISFVRGGSWSYYGRDSLSIPFPQPTMNFGWLHDHTSEIDFRAITLHEFGHALSLIHEHQQPNANVIQWNRPAVYAYYASLSPPWSRQQVDHWIFRLYFSHETQFSHHDPASIMHYSIPASLTLNGFSVGWNHQLSLTDRQFISWLYPFRRARDWSELMTEGDDSKLIAGEKVAESVEIDGSGI